MIISVSSDSHNRERTPPPHTAQQTLKQSPFHKTLQICKVQVLPIRNDSEEPSSQHEAYWCSPLHSSVESNLPRNVVQMWTILQWTAACWKERTILYKLSHLNPVRSRIRNWKHKAHYKVLPGKLKADTRRSILSHYNSLVLRDVARNSNMPSAKFATWTISSVLSVGALQTVHWQVCLHRGYIRSLCTRT
jgi:hypothetical protein